MLTIGKYLRFRRPEVPVHDGERECGGGARRGSLVSHLTQRRVQGEHKVMIMIISTEYDASYEGCLGPSGHSDCADHERTRHHQEPPDQGLGAGQQRLEARDFRHPENRRRALHVSDQH